MPGRRQENPKIIAFPKNDRWLLCPCGKCVARRKELARVG
jgi:hypothetical protein